MVTRDYTLEQGSLVVPLDGKPLGLLAQGSGYGLPPVEVRWHEGAGDGSTYRHARIARREFASFSVLVNGTDADDLQKNADLLARVLDPTRGQTILRVNQGSDSWWTSLVRTGGGDPIMGEETNGSSWAVYNLSLAAGDPFWTRTRASQQIVRAAGLGRGLIRPGGSLTQLRVSSGQAMGSVLLENPGTANAYPVATVVGPGTGLDLVSARGEVLRWDGQLEAGEVRVFDHRTGTVVDGSGVNRYDELGPAPRFWSIPPGSETATVSLEGASSASSVTLSWRPRRWLVT